jgi:transcriptional antiterminator
MKRAQLNEVMQTAISGATDPNNGQYFIDMPKLWAELLSAHELPDDLILSPKEIIKDTTKIQLMTQQAQMDMQKKLAEDNPQPQVDPAAA